MKFLSAACALVAALTFGATALAGAPPQPARPVPANLYSGRWYEIARTNNHMQADCQASTTDFSGWRAGVFSVVQTCHKGAVSGPMTEVNAEPSPRPWHALAYAPLAAVAAAYRKAGADVINVPEDPEYDGCFTAMPPGPASALIDFWLNHVRAHGA